MEPFANHLKKESELKKLNFQVDNELNLKNCSTLIPLNTSTEILSLFIWGTNYDFKTYDTLQGNAKFFLNFEVSVLIIILILQ